jgi:hypothetical protein
LRDGTEAGTSSAGGSAAAELDKLLEGGLKGLEKKKPKPKAAQPPVAQQHGQRAAVRAGGMWRPAAAPARQLNNGQKRKR